MAAGSWAAEVFRHIACRAGIPVKDMLAEPGVPGRLLRRQIGLSDVAETAAFFASYRAAALTATIANISAGSILD